MRVLEATGSFFQSYESIALNYSEAGAAIIIGETKAGKSTALDLLSWTLYGVTSKDSSADDIRSWFAKPNDVTEGNVNVQLPGGEILTVTRKRASRSSGNDLYYTLHQGEPQRGKDALDTQKKIEQLLGVTSELFLNAAYMHQFSRADSFFVAKAKDRREVVEKIQDLSFPIKLAERASDRRKIVKKQVESTEIELSRIDGRYESMKDHVAQLARSSERWEQDQKLRIQSLKDKSKSFNDDKEARVMKLVDQLEQLDKIIVDPKSFETRIKSAKDQIKKAEAITARLPELDSTLADLRAEMRSTQNQYERFTKMPKVCPECMGPTHNDNSDKYRKELSDQLKEMATIEKDLEADAKPMREAKTQQVALLNSLASLKDEDAANNQLISKEDNLRSQALTIREEKDRYAEQIQTAQKETNPHKTSVSESDTKIAALKKDREAKVQEIDALKKEQDGLSWIYDKSFQVKAMMLEGAVRQLEDRTNEILETYFDATIRVQFRIVDGDKIETDITNDGYECPYKQMSGGERCMLKLAFGIAYMEAAQDCAGVHISVVMLDEALNGLSSSLKMKAFNLIEHLTTKHESVFVIDHDENLKTMFYNRLQVAKEGSKSILSQAST